jgi:potassium efflux system protein
MPEQLQSDAMSTQRAVRPAHFLRSIACLCAMAIVWVAGSVARAETPSPGSSEIEQPAEPAAIAPQAIALEDVPDRAEATRVELDALLPKAAPGQTLERIGSELDRTLPDVESLLATIRETLAARPGIRILNQSEAELSAMQERLRPWDDELDRQLAMLRPALAQLDGIAAVWEATNELAQREGATASTLKLISAARHEIDQTHSAVLARRNQILAVMDRLVDPSAALSASLRQVQSDTEQRLTGILRVDRPPLWSPEVRASIRDEWRAAGTASFLQSLKEGGQYVRAHTRVLGFQLALFLALGLGMRALRDRARMRAKDEYDLRDAEKVFERPWAMALVICLLLSTPLHPLAPRYAGALFAVLFMFAVIRIGRRFLVPAMAPLAWGFIVLFVVDRSRVLLDTMPTIERIAFLMEMAGALGFLLWLLRPRRLVDIPPELRRAPFLRVLGVAMRVAVALLGLAIAADLAGWGDLSGMLGRAALRGSFVGFTAFVVFKVLGSMAAFALILWPLRLLRSISQNRGLVRRWIDQFVAAAVTVLWATMVLGQLALLGPVVAGLSRVLAAAVHVGALSVSVGDVMAFGVTVWLSYLLAHLVDFVLREDVFTRVQTGRGVPYAISGLVRYTLIFFGFIVGLSAAGFELSKLTIILGGLGVGVGFGLQNVVSNFVSGLILLFERPIQVGDAIQLSGMWGSIRSIGIRASVIRRFDGADVIVPNETLITGEVTNWTYADKRRRMEIDVGVDYGTPAQRVIDLLVEVAKANPKVIADPEPRAYFTDFGDSSLDFKLRVWVEDFSDGYSTKSDLSVAVQEALAQAGIGVPFPQRDLHVVSVSPGAATELARHSSPSPPPGKPPGSNDES